MRDTCRRWASSADGPDEGPSAPAPARRHAQVGAAVGYDPPRRAADQAAGFRESHAAGAPATKFTKFATDFRRAVPETGESLCRWNTKQRLARVPVLLEPHR